MADARIIPLGERDPCLFPRSDLFDAAGHSRVLSATRDLKAVELRDVSDGLELRARGLIGYLPLTAEITLNLQPKFPILNLWRMLTVADATYDKIVPVVRSYEHASSTPPHQLLTRSFCHYLRQILKSGIGRGYYPEEVQGHYKPKVHFGRTVSRFLSRGDQINVASDYFNFSPKLPPNSMLKAACQDFLRIIPVEQKWNSERMVIGDALNALERTNAVRMRPGDHLDTSAISIWLRGPYEGALSVHSVLLGYSGIGFGYEAFGLQMPSFLFSLDDIFESYVRNVLRQHLRAVGIAVLDGNKPQHHGRLFFDNRQFPTKPDLIFRREGKILGLGEVKYKHKLEESDRYQVLSHVVAADTHIGIWFSPAVTAERAGLEYIGSIRAGAKFWHYRLDISADLDATSSQMVKDVSALLVSP